MNRKFLTFLCVFFCAVCSLSAAPKTDVYIGITSTGGKKLPMIAMPDFVAKEDASAAAETVYNTLRADILYARYFDVSADGPAFEAAELSNTLKGWSKKHANYLIGGNIVYAEPY